MSWYLKAADARTRRSKGKSDTPADDVSTFLFQAHFKEIVDLYLAEGELDQAAFWYKGGIELGDPPKIVYMKIAEMYVSDGAHENAVTWYEKAAETAGTLLAKAEIYKTIAESVAEKAGAAAARPWYDKAIALHIRHVDEIEYEDEKVEAYKGVAALYEAAGDKEKALEWHLRAIEAVEEGEDRVEALHNLGDFYSEAKDHQTAIRWYRKMAAAAASRDGRARAFAHIAGAYAELEDPAAAAEWYHKAAQEAEDQKNVARYYGKAAAQKSKAGDRETAIQWYGKAAVAAEQAVKIASDDGPLALSFSTVEAAEFRAAIAGEYVKAADLENAVRSYAAAADAAKKNTDKAEYFERIGDLYGTSSIYFDHTYYLPLEFADRKAAETWYRKAISFRARAAQSSLDGDRPSTWVALNQHEKIAEIYNEKLKQRDKAIEWRLKAHDADDDGDEGRHIYYIAWMFDQRSEPDQRISWLKRSLEKGDDDTKISAMADMGEVLRLKGDEEAARSWYRQAIRIKQRMIETTKPGGIGMGKAYAYGELADLLEKAGDKDAALAAYERKAELGDADDKVSVYASIASLYGAEDLDNARKYYLKAAQATTGYGRYNAYSSLARLYSEADRAEEELEYLRLALDASDDRQKGGAYGAYRDLAEAHARLDRLDEAERNYSKALQLSADGDKAEILERIGEMYAKADDHARAKGWYEKALAAFTKASGGPKYRQQSFDALSTEARLSGKGRRRCRRAQADRCHDLAQGQDGRCRGLGQMEPTPYRNRDGLRGRRRPAGGRPVVLARSRPPASGFGLLEDRGHVRR